MGFKNNAIIIWAPRVLNELPKYWDMIKTQSALDLHRKKEKLISGHSTFTVVHGTWKKNQSTLYLRRRKYFFKWLQCYSGAWDLINLIRLVPHLKKIFLFVYSTTMVRETPTSFYWYLTLTEKKYIAVSGYKTTMKRETLKILIGNRIPANWFPTFFSASA